MVRDYPVGLNPWHHGMQRKLEILKFTSQSSNAALQDRYPALLLVRARHGATKSIFTKK